MQGAVREGAYTHCRLTKRGEKRLRLKEAERVTDAVLDAMSDHEKLSMPLLKDLDS